LSRQMLTLCYYLMCLPPKALHIGMRYKRNYFFLFSKERNNNNTFTTMFNIVVKVSPKNIV